MDVAQEVVGIDVVMLHQARQRGPGAMEVLFLDPPRFLRVDAQQALDVGAHALVDQVEQSGSTPGTGNCRGRKSSRGYGRSAGPWAAGGPSAFASLSKLKAFCNHKRSREAVRFQRLERRFGAMNKRFLSTSACAVVWRSAWRPAVGQRRRQYDPGFQAERRHRRRRPLRRRHRRRHRRPRRHHSDAHSDTDADANSNSDAYSHADADTATNYNTTEYRGSIYSVAADALAAYNAGATGKGVKIGIVDSGINPNLPGVRRTHRSCQRRCRRQSRRQR